MDFLLFWITVLAREYWYYCFQMQYFISTLFLACLCKLQLVANCCLCSSILAAFKRLSGERTWLVVLVLYMCYLNFFFSNRRSSFHIPMNIVSCWIIWMYVWTGGGRPEEDVFGMRRCGVRLSLWSGLLWGVQGFL